MSRFDRLMMTMTGADQARALRSRLPAPTEEIRRPGMTLGQLIESAQSRPPALTEEVRHELTKGHVWSVAREVPGWPNFRRDRFGRLMKWSEYGQSSDYGWEIDHIVPRALGFGHAHVESALNKEALHWLSNRRKSDKLI